MSEKAMSKKGARGPSPHGTGSGGGKGGHGKPGKPGK